MTGEKAKDRNERLAAALRDNLRRRKSAHRPPDGGTTLAPGDAGPARLADPSGSRTGADKD